MRRRTFIAALGGATAYPLAARLSVSATDRVCNLGGLIHSVTFRTK
jgi:hypothetical protein